MLGLVLAGSMVISMTSPVVDAAAKMSLSKKKITITQGEKVTLKVKKATKKVKWSVTKGKKVIKLSKKKKASVVITGKKAGTTFVVIDGVKYIITVTEEQLQDVLLPINLWITNTGVVPTGWSDGTPSEFTYTDDAGNRRSTYTLKATYGGVYSENGIELSGILPSPDGKATSWDGKTYDVTYWKSAYHSADVSQSTDGWTNNSHKGI